MDSVTRSGRSVPPFTLVTAPLGTPGLAGVPRPGLADTPPHGPIFCGSPRRFWINDAAGWMSTKCASAPVDRLAATITPHRILLFIRLLDRAQPRSVGVNSRLVVFGPLALGFGLPATVYVSRYTSPMPPAPMRAVIS